MTEKISKSRRLVMIRAKRTINILITICFILNSVSPGPAFGAQLGAHKLAGPTIVGGISDDVLWPGALNSVLKYPRLTAR